MKRIIFILVFLSAGLMVSAQMAQNSTLGKEFWFSFMQNGYKENSTTPWVETQVMICAKRACSGTVSNPRTSWSMPFEVEDDSAVVLSIPENQGYNENNEGIPSDFGILLTATDTVSVFIANCAKNTFDASFVLPIESLGSNYIVQSAPQSKLQTSLGFYDMETSAFLIVATEDNTVITINPSVTTLDGHLNFENYSITLDRGQTYSMRTRNHPSMGMRDFSGTRINSQDGKKIAVFNGNTLVTIPFDSSNAYAHIFQQFDHIFEQALPVETWGKHFAITGSATRTRDLLKITAGAKRDEVRCNGVLLATLDKGESYKFWLYSNPSGNQTIGGGSCYIETSKPSMVYLYHVAGYDPEVSGMENGDPSMVWIPPVEQKSNEIVFGTFNQDNATIDNHYVNVVVDSKSVDEVYLDSVVLDTNVFHPLIGNRDFCYAQVEVSHGVHHLSCEWGLTAHVYGFGYAKGYAYCPGVNVVDLKNVLFINGQSSAIYHDSLQLCIGEEANYEVRTNYPVRSVVWSFDGTPIPGGSTASHIYDQAGDFVTKAIVEGFNAFTNEKFYDTLTVSVHVRAAGFADLAYVLCDEDSFEFHGETYTESGYYEQNVPNANDCDSVFHFTLDMDFTPDFSILGDHWPIGGSETYISINEYAIALDDPRTLVDTVIWQVDCPNWNLIQHGSKGKECILYIYSFLEEPVLLHAWVNNRCDTIQKDFFIQTSYFGVDENEEDPCFTVSPNPSKGDLVLHFGDLENVAEITVCNALGQRIDTFSVDINAHRETTYTIPAVKNGVYYLLMRCMDKTQIRKVIILR